jgi:predicted nucleic acid-binding protein
MGETDQRPVVSDAGPIIHLDELACLDLLGGFGTILVPREVWDEVSHHRPHLVCEHVPCGVIVEVRDRPTPRLLALADSLALDSGERAALTMLEAGNARLFLCDDAAARLAAESFGFTVHGTIGLLIRAIRVGTRTREDVLTIMRALPQRSTLHLSGKLLTAVVTTLERS